MASNVVGLFDTIDDAQATVQELRDNDFAAERISFVMTDTQGERSAELGGIDTEAAEGAGFGATGGAVLGGLSGLLVGLGTLAIPGIGPVLGAGTLATALGSTALGAGLGAAAGGLVGALVGAGIPEEHADVYAESVRRGSALVLVRTDDHDSSMRAANIMNRHNAIDVDERGREYRAGGWTRFDSEAQPPM